MIGQVNLKSELARFSETGFPRFSILCGSKGSGRKMIAEHIASLLKVDLVICKLKIDDVREIIHTAMTQKVPALYVFPDADTMSVNAKNALLKITEEPPQNAYFLLTISDKNNILPTLISRGLMFNIDPYTPNEIEEILDSYNYDLKPIERRIVSEICKMPGDISVLISYGLADFYEYCERVLDNISEVDGANAFKIAMVMDTKGEGWNIALFLDTISLIALNRLKSEQNLVYYDVIKLCSKYKQELKITGISKQMLADSWVIEMRQVM